MDRGAWRASVHGVTKESDMTEQLRTAQQLNNIPIFASLVHKALNIYHLAP